MKHLLFIALFALSSLAICQPKNTILVLGDSLSAGYGIKIEQSWPTLLQEKMNKQSVGFKVHNASISGQTSSEGVRQIDQLLQLTQPKLVVLELGANDGLRGLSITEMQANLQTIIDKSLRANAQVLLIGIRVPSNYGRRYGEMFINSYDVLAKKNTIPFVPFLLTPLESIINDENRGEYIQQDGLHPTAKSQPLILEYLWPSIKKLIQ
ncbi:MAG: acyl-CoA thioesterase-1 [Oceanicoccus sp.]|jgi:acyl-CoA thioesterase-1